MFFFTVQYARKQWGEANRMADASIISAAATTSAAETASKTLLQSIKQANLDERPWVGIKEYSCDGCSIKPDGSLVVETFQIRFENTGRTPAVDVKIDAISKTLKMTDPIPTIETLHALQNNAGGHPLPPAVAKEMDTILKFRVPQHFVIAPGAWSDQKVLDAIRLEGSPTLSPMANESQSSISWER